ncbi:MAG: DUF3618 domain-containing protein, partial [Frankia sp.]|nr:DUF3618 domain-containing protein [Frankia sp.]
MGARPEEIRVEIEQTRDRITAEVDQLSDRLSPSRVASRKVREVRSAASSMRSKVGAGATGAKHRLRGGSHLAGHTGDGEAYEAGARLAESHRRAELANARYWDARRRSAADAAQYEVAHAAGLTRAAPAPESADTSAWYETQPY